MFEELTALVGALKLDTDVSKYTQVKDARKTLQAIKAKAQELRNELTAKFKATKVK